MPDRTHHPLTRYRLRDDVRIANVAGEGVVLHLGSRRYFSTNATALVMLQLLAQPRTRAELVDGVLQRFDVVAERAEQGVHAFLQGCLEHEFVVVLEPESERT